MPAAGRTQDRRLAAFLAACALTLTVGCPPSDRQDAGGAPANHGLPRAEVTLRVGVLADESLRRAIDRLRGEWRTQTDGEIESVALAAEADLAPVAGEVDLLVFPSRRLGELCEAGVLRPVRQGVLKSETLRFDDFLPLVRDHEVAYAQQVMALPLGSPTPLLLTTRPNATVQVLPPSDELVAALSYLAWAAPHAVHPSRVATLFDADDFSPRLTEPPFVRALEGYAAACDAQAAGRIAWPQRDEPAPEGSKPAALPGADEAYNGLADQWEPLSGEARHATLIGSSGRLIGVTGASRNAATAFRLAAWLAGPENARMLSTASDHVANCRGSLARAPDPWRATEDRELAKAFAMAGADALRRPRHLMTPRMPGGEQYLNALGRAVLAAIAGDRPADALRAAAAEWEAISEQRGRASQKRAYLRSINAAAFPTN